MTADRLRGETPFPQAGEGVSLYFTNSACVKLQAQFGDKWITGAFERLNQIDANFAFTCIKLGARKDGKPFNVDIDKMEVPVKDLMLPVLDALFMSVHGQTFDEHLKELMAQMKAAELSGEPPLPEQIQETTSGI